MCGSVENTNGLIILPNNKGSTKVGGKERWGSGGEAPGKFFGATPLKTLGNASFEDRNTPF